MNYMEIILSLIREGKPEEEIISAIEYYGKAVARNVRYAAIEIVNEKLSQCHVKGVYVIDQHDLNNLEILLCAIPFKNIKP